VSVEISCIHLIIYRCFKQQSEGRIYINYNCVREILRRRLHKFPKAIHYKVLKEMEDYGLIKRNGNSRNIIYELTGGNKDNEINQYTDLI
jgi:hypothetical protein